MCPISCTATDSTSNRPVSPAAATDQGNVVAALRKMSDWRIAPVVVSVTQLRVRLESDDGQPVAVHGIGIRKPDELGRQRHVGHGRPRGERAIDGPLQLNRGNAIDIAVGHEIPDGQRRPLDRHDAVARHCPADFEIRLHGGRAHDGTDERTHKDSTA
jgi:hypothetical protein